MALRTFSFNPLLGGFGNESTASSTKKQQSNGSNKNICSAGKSCSDSDAVAQIVKELVDNAVDACAVITRICKTSPNISASEVKSKKYQAHYKENEKKLSIVQSNDGDKPKRVRVTIEPVEQSFGIENETSGESQIYPEYLRVTVSDNGCGMKDIQEAVNAFRTSKGHNCKNSTKAMLQALHSKAHDGPQYDSELGTTGRYGVGLTMCLLHAQRLVPTSCASIQSATLADAAFTKVLCVIDLDHDAVRCIRPYQLSKSSPTESGTSVSLVIPVSKTPIPSVSRAFCVRNLAFTNYFCLVW
jgi:DNA topoisomerase VI subunit B